MFCSIVFIRCFYLNIPNRAWIYFQITSVFCYASVIIIYCDISDFTAGDTCILCRAAIRLCVISKRVNIVFEIVSGDYEISIFNFIILNVNLPAQAQRLWARLLTHAEEKAICLFSALLL